MSNLVNTYQHIADILSFETSNTELEKNLGSPEFNWDNIVKEGSKHLVLPAIFCRLKAKKLLHVLPSDLNTFLEEITKINRNRNLSIIKQIQSISKLFNENKINHVFLKGSALIVSGFYNDIAERMIGDIDILIEENQLHKAFKLLKDQQYNYAEKSLGERFFEHKHLPRLIKDNQICCVELHRRLFISKKEKYIKRKDILLNKQKIQEISIPSSKLLLYYNILNYQIDDYGNIYNSINFRSAYDTVVLLKNKGIDLHKVRLIDNYINILGIFFNDVTKMNSKKNFSARFYLYRLNHINFYKFWNTIIRFRLFIARILKRFPHFISNKAYRKAVLDDRKRIFDYFMSIISHS